MSNFKALRQRPDLCYFDKTAFIMALESFPHDVLVFLRPRRSGKSLALSSLAHFHGREHLPDYKPLFEVSDFLLFNDHSFLLKMLPCMLIGSLLYYL